MHCENCGATLPQGVKTCVKCGARTDVSAFAANVGAPTAPARRKVEAPRRSSRFLAVAITLLILAAAWFAFQWFSSR